MYVCMYVYNIDIICDMYSTEMDVTIACYIYIYVCMLDVGTLHDIKHTLDTRQSIHMVFRLTDRQINGWTDGWIDG